MHTTTWRDSVLRTAFQVVIATLLAVGSAGALAQAAYEEELQQLSGTLRSLLVQTERAAPQDVATTHALRSEFFELSKKLHRLEEEALGANLDLQRRGLPTERRLLLAAAVSKALDLSQSLASFYLDTREKVFWTSATQAAQTARTLLAQHSP